MYDNCKTIIPKLQDLPPKTCERAVNGMKTFLFVAEFFRGRPERALTSAEHPARRPYGISAWSRSPVFPMQYTAAVSSGNAKCPFASGTG